MSNKKEKIMEAYIQLLDENPEKRVTVNSIVARCGVSRNTFYYYFPDISSLISEMEERWVKLIETTSEGVTLVECLRPLAKYAEEHRVGLLHAYHNASQTRFQKSLNMLWDAILRRCACGRCEYARSEEEKRTKILLMKSVFVGMTINWLDAEMSYDLIEEGYRVREMARDGRILDCLKKPS